ncbi:pentapeptide repeat-containing protein [Streptomyces sp. NPDC046832]|uniref:pentapeptide repeat-containing protein n=1 Tax=Streptomyces sp. NPDC046832 TaxID=3155020 RepID=UPI0033C512A4
MIVFTWLSIQQVDDEHALTREGQVTDRYNAAVTNIGEESMEVRLGGIYALQRIMEDSPRDQPSIVNVLSTYIRNHAKKPRQVTDASSREPASDVKAALTALGNRDSAHDGTADMDLRGAYLPGANLFDANLQGADLSGAYLHHANLSDADLRGVYLLGAELSDTYVANANLSKAILLGANLISTNAANANLSGAYLRGADLHEANLRDADLSDTDLHDADLSDSDLHDADLSDSDLHEANLRDADLSGANLRGAASAQPAQPHGP